MKETTILSWNVNGIRAVAKKGFSKWIERAKPDVLCLQETKAHPDQLDGELRHPNGYTGLWNAAERKGYSGVATFVKEKPLSEMSHFGNSILDGEGRMILTEHPAFFLFNVYFPNGKRDHDRLAYKLAFYEKFLDLAQAFRKKKPIVFCGDINTAHHPIDLARPKENEKTSGFLPIERRWLDKMETKGYRDTFRLKHPNEAGQYSWWDTFTRARSRNVGWRIDAVWVSEELTPRIKDAFILSEVMGSDHCPVGVTLSV